MGCIIERNGLQIISDNLLKMNINLSSGDIVCETAVLEKLRNHLSTDRVHKLLML